MADFFDDTMFSRYRDYIYEQSGISFSESNRSILESRLKERLKQHNIATPREYFDMLKTDEGETRGFLDSITTNLTRFFRNQAHYDTFINYVIPDLVEYKRSRGMEKKTGSLERRLFNRRRTLYKCHGSERDSASRF
jgi:chemotaxis protein methyltransferase CheR